MADLEYSLRAIAIAEQRQPDALANAERAAHVRQKLVEINQRINSQTLRDALDTAYSAGLKLDNRAALEAAADRLGELARQLGANESLASEWTELDELLPKPDQYYFGNRQSR